MFRILTFITYPILWMRIRHLKKNRRLTTLCFHNVSVEDKPFYPHLNPKIFDQLLGFVSRHFEVVNFKTLDQKKNGSKPLMVLSFDDAYLNYFEVALPLLQKHQLTSVLSVITCCQESNQTYIWQAFINYFERIGEQGCIEFGKTHKFYTKTYAHEQFAIAFTSFFQQLSKATIDALATQYLSTEDYNNTPMMTWDQIKKTAQLGHEIAAHTHKHYYLLSLTEDEIQEEISVCKQLLEKELNQQINTFTFPGSRFAEGNLKMAHEIGFKNLLLVENKSSDVNASTIFRYLIYGNSTFRILLIALGIENLLRGKHA